MARPERHKLPPRDFAQRELPIETVPSATTFVRIHQRELDPLYFGKTGANRFDDPDGQYEVCYVARSHEGAFAETCLRAVGAQFVAATFLHRRSFAVIETTALLRLVLVHGSGLARLGATSIVSAGDHAISQVWSRAIYEHPSSPDGLCYRANHDNGEICAALFDRCREGLKVVSSQPVLSNRAQVAAMLDRYKVGLG